MIQSERIPIVAKCLSGLEPLLEKELQEIGVAEIVPGFRAVSGVTDTDGLYRTVLTTRLATRLLVPLQDFRATDSRSLYGGVAAVDWSRFLDPDATFVIDAVANKSRFRNSMYAAQCAKDAIVDQIRNKTGRRPSIDNRHPDLRLNLHIQGTRGSIALDASGEPLHRRGYRRESGAAPLNEVLAAGIVMMSGWDGESTLIDPMCGSGTLCIEAALLARKRAPGLIRSEYGFMKWRSFSRPIYRRVMAELEATQTDNLSIPIIGSDIDARRVTQARDNARRAGVAGDIDFKQRPIERVQPPPPPGTLVMNPPYGERLDIEDVTRLYRDIGDSLKNRFQGYEAHVLTGNPEAAKSIGLRASGRKKLFNGAIECRLLRFELYSGSKKQKKQENEG